MTLEQRARLIADLPATADVYAIALKHLREAIGQEHRETMKEMLKDIPREELAEAGIV